MLQVQDDCLIAFNGLTACGPQHGLELQRSVADPQDLLSNLPSAPCAIPNGFPAICFTYVGSALSVNQAPVNIMMRRIRKI